jgi:hypothetical protein
VRPGGVTGAWPCDVEVGVAVGRFACVEAGADELGDPTVGDPVGLGLPLVGDGAVDVAEPEGGPTGQGGSGSAGDSPGRSTLAIPVGSACRTGRSSAGSRAGGVTPGNDTPDRRLSPTAAIPASKTTVAPRATSATSRVRCPCGSANT